MRAGSLLLLVVLCLLAAGCGGGGDKHADTSTTAAAGTTVAAPEAGTTAAPSATANGPDATVRGYFKALAGRDGDTACSLLTASARRHAIATVKASRKKSYKTCGEALVAVVSATSDAQLQTAVNVQITKSVVKGDAATVAVKGSATDFGLRRMGGRWLIETGIG